VTTTPMTYAEFHKGFLKYHEVVLARFEAILAEKKSHAIITLSHEELILVTAALRGMVASLKAA
jgi:hypothetical protein